MATMKMTGCLALVAKMPQSDQDALLARVDQYKADGIPAERAQVMAANDVLAEIRAERTQLMSAIAEQHPDLLTVTQPQPAMSQRQVDTPEFKRWFGDSKVVDENGEPLVVYHATVAEGKFNVFWTYPDMEMGAHFGTYEQARDVRSDSTRIYRTYLSIQNPLRLEDRRGSFALYQIAPQLFSKGIISEELYESIADETDAEQSLAVRAALEAAGYDGIVYLNRREGIGGVADDVVEDGNSLTDQQFKKKYPLAADSWIAFRPEQIKSATGNSGAFDPADPDIRRSSRQRNALGLYSALAEGVEGIKTNAAPAAGWRDAIKGLVNKGQVKADEVEWSGINDWLALQQGKVSKDAVVEYLRGNGVQVEEVVLGDSALNTDDLDAYEQADDSWNIQRISDRSFVMNVRGFRGDPEGAIAEAAQRMADLDARTKYGKWTLPGGENYREVLLALPETKHSKTPKGEVVEDGKDKDFPFAIMVDGQEANRSRTGGEVAQEILQEEIARVAGKRARAQQYKSSHWDQANVLAHIRVNDRTDADGNKVLFVEEIQSDWGQEGKKRGFAPQNVEAQLKEGEERMRRRGEEIRRLSDRMAALTDNELDEFNRLADERQRLQDEQGAEMDWGNGLYDARASGVPAAPFVTAQKFAVFKDGKEVTRTDEKSGKEVKQRYDSMEAAQAAAKKSGGEARDLGLQANTEGWLNLALKRVLTMAVEGGYDKVAFTTGAQNAERFSLDKTLREIAYEPAGEGRYEITATDLQGREVISEDEVTLDRIEQLVGKEIAERIARDEGEKEDGGYRDWRYLRGDNLKVEAKGMRAFYDTIVPNAVRTLAKKLGGQVETVNLDRTGGYRIEDDGRSFVVYDPQGNVERRVASQRTAEQVVQELAGGTQQPGLTITDAMREKVGEGLPMFSRRQDVAAAEEALDLVRKARAYEPMEGEERIVFPILYHSGTGDPDALAKGVEPQFGSWVAEVLDGAYDGETEIDPDESFVPLSYYASAPEWVRIQTARNLGKQYNEVTLDDIRNRGQLAIVYNVDEDFGEAKNEVFQIGPDGYNGGYTEVIDVYGKKRKLYETGLEEEGDFRSGPKQLFGVEPGDIVTNQSIEPDVVLTGDALVEFMRRYQAEVDPSIKFSRRQRQAGGIVFGRDELGRVNFAPGAKAYDIVANVANNVLDKIAMKPVSDELGRAMRNMKVEVERVQNQIAMTAKELEQIPQDEREMISDVIEGELRAGIHPPQHVLQVAASMQSIMSEQSRELVRLGMLSQEAANRWDQKYLPRFYESKLGDEVTAWAKAAKALFGRQPMMQGIRGSSLKARGMFETVAVADLPQWLAQGWEQRDANFDPATSTETVVWRDYSRQEREDMGEIRDAMFRFVMGYNRTQRDIALGRLYESLAQNYASAGPQDGYVLVPDTKVEGTMAARYGKLAGKYVPKEVMDHLSVNDETMMEGLFKIYKAGLSKWKEGKTVLNPVSHANNVISNLTMAHFAGVSYWDVQKYAGAVKDLVTRDPMVAEAKDIGLFGGTFNQSEIVASMPPQLRAMAGMSESKIAKLGEGLWDILAYTVSWNGKKYGARPVMQWAYENEDLFFRYLVYRDARGRGMAPEDAREYAQQFLFTYDDLPKGARTVRDVGLPFFSYTYKVVPVLARTALEYPWRYAAPAVAAYAANAMMYAMAASMGGDDDDWWGKVLYKWVTDKKFRERARALEDEERKNLPPWMKGGSAMLGTPKAVRLGMDSVTGLPMFLDISRMFPGGDLLDAQNNAGGVALLQPLTPSNPVLTTTVAMLANKDMFFGRDVVKATDTDAEKAQKRAAWLWKQVSPAIAVGNYHFDRSLNVIVSMTGKPITVDAGPLGVIDYTGTGRDGLPVQPGLAALQTMGIKVRPYDLDTSEQMQTAEQKKLVRELTIEIKRIDRLENKGAISPEAAELMRSRQQEKRARVREGLTVDGEERK